MRTRSFRIKGGQRDREQRRHERERGCVDHRQQCERGEIAEHGADRGEAAPEMADRTADTERGDQLASPRIDDDNRQDRECGPEEHHLPDRVAVTQPAHQHRHHGKDKRRGDLEQDGPEEMHRLASLVPPSDGSFMKGPLTRRAAARLYPLSGSSRRESATARSPGPSEWHEWSTIRPLLRPHDTAAWPRDGLRGPCGIARGERCCWSDIVANLNTT